MKLRVLLILLVILSLAGVSLPSYAKEHDKKQHDKSVKVLKTKANEKSNPKKTDKKHLNQDNHKRANANKESLHSQTSVEKSTLKAKQKKHGCNDKSCVVPQLPKGATPALLATQPKTGFSALPSPTNPVNDLLDQTANEAKQKVREMGQ